MTERTMNRVNGVISAVLIGVCIVILSLAVGYSLGAQDIQDKCDWDTELYDGRECLSREDHAAHDPTDLLVP